MPRARQFTKLIELWGTTPQADGFGGNTVTEAKITDIWASLRTLDSMRYSSKDFGDIDFANSVKVTIRDNSNLSIDYKNNFIVYLGEKYFFKDNTVVKDFRKNYINFIIVKNV